MLEQILADCPDEIDLTNEEHAEITLTAVEALLSKDYDIPELERIEDQLLAMQDPARIFILLALKIAKSKLLASRVSEPLFISVVFAIYKEHNRIKKSSEHPHGEDFLLKKVEQLNWLFGDQPNIDWELILVDDGCPEGSGEIAQGIIDAHQLHDCVRVRYLSEAIQHKYPPAQGLRSTSESMKGGSIVYGMWDAVQAEKAGDHIVLYTDADLSTHLGQVMLLVDPLLHADKLVAIGSRRRPRSVVIKKGTRNNRGKLFIYLWKRLIPNLGEIVDTQCGFKAFRSEIIPEVIDDLIEKKFAFDIELLLKTSLHQEDAITRIPIAWIDSEAASTTTDLQPYLSMLKAIVRMNERYFPDEEESHEFADYIRSLDDQAFNNLLDNIPTAITERSPDAFTSYDKVRVADLQHAS